MLNRIELKNFRRHRDAVFTFGAGHNVIRGLNEGGKTTIAEAIAYAFFGAAAFREGDALADVVTWGEKETTLKVVLECDFGGVLHTFSRGKGGAECLYGLNRITGQKEVTAYAAELLGADFKLASKLMIAGQKGLAGALAEGATKTAEMIEGMADFDLFERITDAMAEQLVLGAPKQFEDRLAAAQAKVDACPEPAPADVAGLESEIAAKASDLAAKRAFAEGPGQEAATAAARALAAAEAAEKTRAIAASNLEAAQAAGIRHLRERDALPKLVAPTDAEIAAQRQRVADAKNHVARRTAYDAVTKLMAGYPEEFWDEPQAALHEQIDQLTAGRESSRRAIADAQRRLEVAQARRVAGSVCGFCDQDVSKFPDVVKKNAEIDRLVQACRDEIEVAGYSEAAEKANLAALQAVLGTAQPYQQAAIRYAAFVDVDESVVPPRLTWKGDIPDGGTNERAEQERLSALEAAKRSAERAEADRDALNRAIVEDHANVARLTEQLHALPRGDHLEELTRAAKAANDDLTLARYWVNELGLQIERHKAEIAAARTEYQNRVKQRARLLAERDECRQQLDELAGNNALREKIRKARPIVSDKLWNTVLHAVSTMFSGMRGEPSLVSKERDGFKVNGKNVTSISGSTLDLLALAIRVAMLKTFLPHCPFLLLDEPFAACDAARTEKMLAFIMSSGFTQTVVITHEDASEAVADNLVTV